MDLLYLADKVGKNNIALKIGKLDENIFAFWKNSKATLITGNDLEQLLDVLALTYLENNKNDLNKDELKVILGTDDEDENNDGDENKTTPIKIPHPHLPRPPVFPNPGKIHIPHPRITFPSFKNNSKKQEKQNRIGVGVNMRMGNSRFGFHAGFGR